jgi:2-polyprenyl-3-methyl-5-hydroxy-6-metoxy-1,4-benzoquinol methylase
MAMTNPTLPDQLGVGEILSRAFPNCSLCGDPGKLLYTELADRLFGAPGTWTLKQCSRLECGLVWLDPMPLEQDIHKAYTNYHTHQDPLAPHDSWLRRAYNVVKQGYLASKYGYRPLTSGWQKALGLLMYLVPSRRAAVDAQVLFLSSKEGGSLLDVGCGNGQTLEWMAALGWQVQGLDTDLVAVQVARSKGLKVMEGGLQSQEFATGSFDVIFMGHVIEHVHAPLSLMKECYRVLKPGGRLIVITPNVRSWGQRFYKSDWRGLEPPRHLQIFARPSLSRLSGLAGFVTCECRAITRGAGDILLASHFLKSNRTLGLRPSRVFRMWAELVSIAEWAGSYLDHDSGEELVLVANK